MSYQPNYSTPPPSNQQFKAYNPQQQPSSQYDPQQQYNSQLGQAHYPSNLQYQQQHPQNIQQPYQEQPSQNVQSRQQSPPRDSQGRSSHRIGNISPNKNVLQQMQSNSTAQLAVNPRIVYLRKLYIALFIQLSIAVEISIWLILDEDFKTHLQENEIYFWVSLTGTILIGLFGLCFRNKIRQSPINIFSLIVWTIFFDSLLVYVLCIFGDEQSGLMVLILLASQVIGQFFYTLTVRYELTIQGSSLFVFGVSLIIFHIFTLFSNLTFFQMATNSFIGLVFAFYLIFDTQSRLAAPDYDFNKEEWKSGVVLTYLDVFLLFLRVADLLKTTIDKKTL